MQTFLFKAKNIFILLIVLSMGVNSASANISYNVDTPMSDTPCHHGMDMSQSNDAMNSMTHTGDNDNCCDEMDNMQCSDEKHDCSQCADCTTALQNIPFLNIVSLDTYSQQIDHVKIQHVSGKEQRLHFYFERPPKNIS
jgi:hypothetical protein